MNDSQSCFKAIAKSLYTQKVSLIVVAFCLLTSNVLVIFLTISSNYNDSSASSLSLPKTKITPVIQHYLKSEHQQDYILAKEQSFGFFTDIPNNEWREFYVRPAREYKPYRFPDDPDLHRENVPFWIFHNWDPYFACPRLRRIGEAKLCDPDRIIAERSDGSPCLIYAFHHGGKEGSMHNWVRGLVNYFHQRCEIHVFGEVEITFRGSNNVVQHVWLPNNKTGTAERDAASPSGIKENLGHGGRSIDILLLDCDGCEWYIYRDIFELQPLQFLVQTHDLPVPERPKETEKFGVLPRMAASEFFDAFRIHNFVLFAKEVLSGADECFETNWSFLRLDKTFLGGSSLT